MLPLGISIGMSVQMGKLLPVSVDRAKKLAACTMIFTVVVAICVATLLHVFQLEVISAFTSDGDVMKAAISSGRICASPSSLSTFMELTPVFFAR